MHVKQYYDNMPQKLYIPNEHAFVTIYALALNTTATKPHDHTVLCTYCIKLFHKGCLFLKIRKLANKMALGYCNNPAN